MDRLNLSDSVLTGKRTLNLKLKANIAYEIDLIS